MYFRVKIESDCYPAYVVNYPATDKHVAEVVARAVYGRSVVIHWIKEDPGHDARLDKVAYWKDIWCSALKNMPGTRKEKNGYISGRPRALLTCLNYKVKPTTTCSLHVKAYASNGSKPRDPWKQQALKKLAGPYGTVFARIQLVKLGLLHKFPHWPVQG